MPATWLRRLRISAHGASRAGIIILLASGISSGLTACGKSEEPQGPYAQEIAEAKKTATTDFEKAVFDDNAVSRAEYEEAVNRYVECAKGQGAAMSAVSLNGYYQYEVVKPDSNTDRVLDGCRKGTIDLVENIYVNMVKNPEKKDLSELQAACFVRVGLAPPDYSKQKLEADKDKSFEGASFDKNDPRIPQCLGNPSAN